jgi:hypothetical protein
MPFIGRRREGRRYYGGELVDNKWSSSMLPFLGEERKGQCPFKKGKGAYGAALGSRAKGRLGDAAVWQRPTARVG